MSSCPQLSDDFARIKPQYAVDKDVDQLLQLWQQTFKYLLSILSRPPGTYELTREKVLKLIRAQQVLIWRKTSADLLACVVIKINKEQKKGKLAVNRPAFLGILGYASTSQATHSITQVRPHGTPEGGTGLGPRPAHQAWGILAALIPQY
ncbi:MAG: hypothetical protein ACFFC7_19525 [Candidatus Hermodarchaeota archaeon]